MLALILLALSLATLTAVAAGSYLLLHRTRRTSRGQSQKLHDFALAFDRRCDALQHHIEAVEQHQDIARLLELVTISERHGKLNAEAARRLERYVLGLHDEAQSNGEVG